MNLRIGYAPILLLFISCTSASTDESSVQAAQTDISGVTHRSTENDSIRNDTRELPERVFSALSDSYPDRVGEPIFQDGQWTLTIGHQLFYWADSRILPEAEKEKSAAYAPYRFWPYPATMPPPPNLSPDEIAELKERIEEREAERDFRNSAFMDALWGMENVNTAENTVISTSFLGKRIRIHPLVQTPLEQVEKRIINAALEVPAVRSWIDGLGSVGAYAWREIAGSANRSLHSYGIAIDVQPRDYKGKQAYWRWAKDFYPNWWAIPYTQRHYIPEQVVDAFAANGFIWGGKWLLFDQIHFEYRPELIKLGEYQSGDEATLDKYR